MTSYKKNAGQGTDVFFEIQQLGESIKITAIDESTGTEVSIQGPATAPLATLQYMAMKKLNYILAKSK